MEFLQKYCFLPTTAYLWQTLPQLPTSLVPLEPVLTAYPSPNNYMLKLLTDAFVCFLTYWHISLLSTSSGRRRISDSDFRIFVRKPNEHSGTFFLQPEQLFGLVVIGKLFDAILLGGRRRRYISHKQTNSEDIIIIFGNHIKWELQQHRGLSERPSSIRVLLSDWLIF